MGFATLEVMGFYDMGRHGARDMGRGRVYTCDMRQSRGSVFTVQDMMHSILDS